MPPPKDNYTQQTSRFHVDLIVRRESNPQSGREPDHHLMLATTERALSGLSDCESFASLITVSALSVVCQAPTGSHLFFKSLRYRLDLRVFPSCHCMSVHTDTDQITRWINSRLRWPELIPARMVFAGILSATSQVSYFHPSGYYRCASACAFTTTARTLGLWSDRVGGK